MIVIMILMSLLIVVIMHLSYIISSIIMITSRGK